MKRYYIWVRTRWFCVTIGDNGFPSYTRLPARLHLVAAQ